MLKLVSFLALVAIACAYYEEPEDILVPVEALPQGTLVRVRRQAFGSFGSFGSGFNFGNLGYPSRSYGGIDLSSLNRPAPFTPTHTFHQPSSSFNFGSAANGPFAGFKNLPIDYQSRTEPISKLTGLTSDTKSLQFNTPNFGASATKLDIGGKPVAGSLVGNVPLKNFGNSKEGGLVTLGTGVNVNQGKAAPTVQLGVNGKF